MALVSGNDAQDSPEAITWAQAREVEANLDCARFCAWVVGTGLQATLVQRADRNF